MSVQLLNDIAIESDETPLNDMANLKLGSSCSSCENKTNNNSLTCRCTALTSGGRESKDAKKCTLFPYFWRKTLLNPFLKSSKKTRRTRIGGHFEILQPSKLSYISVPSQSPSSSTPSSSSSTNVTSTSTTITTNSNNNKIKTSITTTTTITSLPGNECNRIPQQQQQLQEQSRKSTTNIREIFLADSTTIPARPAFNICTGTFQPSLLLPDLPDFTSLSIKGMNEEHCIGDKNTNKKRQSIIRDEIGENETTSRLLLGKRTSNQSITELNGAMLNFRLDSRSGSSTSRSSSRSSIKIPKWKSRVKCSYKTKALSPLGPILEVEAELNVPTSSPTSNNSSNFSNCSQQALMENGGRWNQDSSSVDNVDDITIDELAGYLDQFIYIGSKQMSTMAEMMYT